MLGFAALSTSPIAVHELSASAAIMPLSSVGTLMVVHPTTSTFISGARTDAIARAGFAVPSAATPLGMPLITWRTYEPPRNNVGKWLQYAPRTATPVPHIAQVPQIVPRIVPISIPRLPLTTLAVPVHTLHQSQRLQVLAPTSGSQIPVSGSPAHRSHLATLRPLAVQNPTALDWQYILAVA